MKTYTKNNLRLKPLTERINGFIVNKKQTQLKEALTNQYVNSDSPTDTNSGVEHAFANNATKATVGASSLNTDSSDNETNVTLTGDTIQQQTKDAQNMLRTTLKSVDPNNINFTYTNPNRQNLNCSLDNLRLNSVSYNKGELNRILLNK